jgi:hypothetical protein
MYLHITGPVVNSVQADFCKKVVAAGLTDFAQGRARKAHCWPNREPPGDSVSGMAELCASTPGNVLRKPWCNRERRTHSCEKPGQRGSQKETVWGEIYAFVSLAISDSCTTHIGAPPHPLHTHSRPLPYPLHTPSAPLERFQVCHFGTVRSVRDTLAGR